MIRGSLHKGIADIGYKIHIIYAATLNHTNLDIEPRRLSGTYGVMSLRKAHKSDASSIAAISIEVWLGTYLKHGVSGFIADYALNEFTTAKTEALISNPDEFILVSENKDGIDGFIRVSSESKAPVAGCSEMEIATFYVQPRHHGKGIGGRLLDAALRYCKEQSAESVWLTTNAENDPAIDFYLARGFEQIGETHFRIEDQGYLNNVYLYRLP
ncbi:GNAT family N-acetyltransferase [Roseibium sp. RKSG952]|uniref:GNAT family N-acetyltransferase n=1 Tax=Roseibium sp. RKSG952 TaxID=2529384 RepID=UPI001FCC9ACE|nr:GNAT family N-acetyltransferase [Roseibium sp. RKSG952]